MFRQLRSDWRRIRRGEPGRRFQDFHNGWRQKRGRSARARLLAVAAGVVVVICGVVLLVTPGPGWAMIFLGITLLATVWPPAGRLIDWSEPKLRGAATKLKVAWNRLSTAGKLGLGMIAGIATAGACYLALMLAIS